MRVLCIFSQYNYGDPSRGEGYEYSNFLPALRRLGHEVLFIENWHRTCYRDFREFNERVLRTVERKSPDVLLSVLVNYELWIETCQILQQAGMTATVNWTTDDSWKYAQFSRLLAPYFHAFTTTYPDVHARYRRDGIEHVLLTQWAANAALLQPPCPAVECAYGVSFVGTAHGNRRRWVSALRARGIDIACFGHGWESGAVAASDIPSIIRNSQISLNFANSASFLSEFRPHTNQIKARVFEVPGAGGFLLSEWAPHLERHYVPDKEIAVFRSLDDLADKICYYLAHPAERDSVAAAGFERTRKEHTYDQRLSAVLDFALCQRDLYFARRGSAPSGTLDWARFEQAARRYSVTRTDVLLKKNLVALCSMIWGQQRGPRAARRLVFELSWRLTGARTYSAAGLPGRLFYEAS